MSADDRVRRPLKELRTRHQAALREAELALDAGRRAAAEWKGERKAVRQSTLAVIDGWRSRLQDAAAHLREQQEEADTAERVVLRPLAHLSWRGAALRVRFQVLLAWLALHRKGLFIAVAAIAGAYLADRTGVVQLLRDLLGGDG